MRKLGVLALLGYIGTIVAANYAVNRWGVVPVGFGYMAPAAVYFVGLAFTLRDITQDQLGRLWTWSFNARRERAMPGCVHGSCTNCVRYALAWRSRLLAAAAWEQLSFAVSR